MEILAPPDSLASLMTVDPFCAQEGIQTLQSSTHFNRLLRVVSDLRLHLEESRLPYTLSSDLLIRNIPLKEGVAPDVALWPESLDLEGEEEYGSVELSADLCPALILEVVSENTHEADAVTKHEIYRLAGIEEYWLYDPRAYAGREPLRGWRLEDMEYVPILGGEPEASGEEVTRYSSAVLQTDWGLTGAGGLRLWDPQQQDWYRTTPAALRQRPCSGRPECVFSRPKPISSRPRLVSSRNGPAPNKPKPVPCGTPPRLHGCGPCCTSRQTKMQRPEPIPKSRVGVTVSHAPAGTCKPSTPWERSELSATGRLLGHHRRSDWHIPGDGVRSAVGIVPELHP